jgi:hypothetical protein
MSKEGDNRREETERSDRETQIFGEVVLMKLWQLNVLQMIQRLTTEKTVSKRAGKQANKNRPSAPQKIFHLRYVLLL